MSHTAYIVIYKVILILNLLDVIKSEEVNSGRKPRALAFQPFKSSSPDFKLNNLFIDKYLNGLKENNVASNGPALFPNDGPPPPRPPLVVTSRPLVEQIARSELNTQPDQDDPKSAVKQSLYEKLLSRFKNNPSDLDKEFMKHPYANVWKKIKNSQLGAQNNKNAYDSVEKQTNLPPIFKALGDFAWNKLQKQKPKLQQYKEYSDDEYEDGEDLEIRGHELKVSSKPRKIYNERKSHFDKNQKYAFSYSVKDDNTGDDFSHKQSSSGQATNGEYRVRLPDGRMQVVTFTADEGGYKADVRYDDTQLIEGLDPIVQNIQTNTNRLDYQEERSSTVKPIIETKEYEQIQGSKEYYEDCGIDYGNERSNSNNETPTSYTNNFRVTSNPQNEAVSTFEQFKLGRIIVPGNAFNARKSQINNKFEIVRYTSTPTYIHDYDDTNRDVVEITPKPVVSGQINQYVTQEPLLYNRVTPNYLSIINQIPYSTKPSVIVTDETDELNYKKQNDQYIYTTTRAPYLNGISNPANESSPTQISLLDSFRNIFKSTLAPFTYKPVTNSYNNFKFNPSPTLPPTPTNSYNTFYYNPSTVNPTLNNSYKNYKYNPSTLPPTPNHPYNNYKYSTSSSTPTSINSYNSQYNPPKSTTNPINAYTKFNYKPSTSTPNLSNSYNFKYHPSSILQQPNSYQITTLKPDFKNENAYLRSTQNPILTNKYNIDNNYKSNSYYTNQYSAITTPNILGIKDENKYFNGNGVFPYASASNTISSTASTLDLVHNIKIDHKTTSEKPSNTKITTRQQITIEKIKFKGDENNGTDTNKTGQLQTNLHHTVIPNLYSYNNYGHLDTKKY